MKTDIKGCAEAFIRGESAHCRNARTNGQQYLLHGNLIAAITRASEPEDDTISFDWCRYYTPTTTSHMNAILKAAGSSVNGRRLSYADARDTCATTFKVAVGGDLV